MSFMIWLFMGLLTGVAVSRVVNKNNEGVVLDVVVGICGAIVGGLSYNAVSAREVSVMSLYGLSVAVLGSVSFLLIYRALFRHS